MQVTIDTKENLDDVLRVISAAYGVEVTAGPSNNGASSNGSRRSSATHRGRRPRNSSADIRAWARSTGYDVSDRGRISADVVHAYEAAHKRSRSR
jgi:hypothetical protein